MVEHVVELKKLKSRSKCNEDIAG